MRIVKRAAAEAYHGKNKAARSRSGNHRPPHGVGRCEAFPEEHTKAPPPSQFASLVTEKFKSKWNDVVTIAVENYMRGEKSIHEVASDWGLQCLRYEIRDISPPCEMKAAMEMQAEAERKSCAQVLESERESQAIINIANEKKNSVILASEDAMMDQVKRAKGEAEAILAAAAEKLRLSSGGFIFFFKSSI
ncbi:hypothetical protein J5N97_025481 [Dioscorea zingiberensis]|uniref:Band 7 domain-containing protein n=1 Tax=Dioscorea zingiberensis TaxID=325984 RepID=A0A9D5C9A8_9LILI|nr:hypothetical protein J5N97_025481 [Dioscorea zingiberensis]